MDTANAYNAWAAQYDTNNNRTRDLEATALRQTLGALSFERCLEIGCGTGKNTEWLLTKAAGVTAVDFSQAMLQKAREKITAAHVQFTQADITGDWTFAEGLYDLVTYSLVLEHIESLPSVFQKTAAVLAAGGYVYVGELHPFKQYAGSKARFETEQGEQAPDCFTHHLSGFVEAARTSGLTLADVKEYFDEDNNTMPRILVLVFRKS
jgi:ubiquinone/menaquinone biosynthesis C-methylase UbiE